MREPGTYIDIDINQYHDDKEYLSSTGLKYARKCLKTFYYAQQGYFDKENHKPFDFGNAMELALCNAKEFEEGVAIVPDDLFHDKVMEANPDVKSFRSTKLYKELYSTWKEDNRGKYIIGEHGKESWDVIYEVLKSCKQDAVISRLIQNTEYQYSLYWKDEETGLNLRTRPDICKVNHNVIVDIKTAIDGHPNKFSKQAANLDYLFQAAMQIDGVIKSGLMPQVDNYYYLVLEKNVPYSATLYRVDEEDLQIAQFMYRSTLKKVAEAKETNMYPSYSDFAMQGSYGIVDLEMPSWWRNQRY